MHDRYPHAARILVWQWRTRMTVVVGKLKGLKAEEGRQIVWITPKRVGSDFDLFRVDGAV